MCAGITRASDFNRSFVVPVPGVANVERAGIDKELAVPGVTRGNHTVEHVCAKRNQLNQVFWRPYAHDIPGERLWKEGKRERCNSPHQILWLPYTQASQCISVKTDICQGFNTVSPKILKHAALNNAEKCTTSRVEALLAAFCPLNAQFQRSSALGVGRRIGGALVQAHHDVGTEGLLDFGGFLRCQNVL